ncbi:MAG TPA: DNA/RNA non-specific endonuclease [Longimicrobiales bacterium]
MIRRNRLSATCLVALFAWSCADAPTQPDAVSFEDAPSLALTAADGVRISEIHYDNASTDAGEAIEIAGPAGTSLDGWSVVLYNGSNGAAYNTRTLSGTIPDQCSGMGTVVLTYPVNGIQNGNPDGIALVSPAGVVEFLSYGGEMAAIGGAANGMMSTDIGVTEGSSTPIGHSVQRESITVWRAPAANTFGGCDDLGGGNGGGGDDDEEPGDSTAAAAFISELNYDPAGTDAGEVFEVSAAAGSSLAGWSVVLYNGNGGASYGTVALTGTIPSDCRARGGLVFDAPGLQNGSPDGLALVDAEGAVVEFISYEGSFAATNGPAAGMTSTDIGVIQNGSPTGTTLQRDSANGAWYGPAANTLGCDEPVVINDDPVFLSELRADQPSGATEEWLEIGGAPGASLMGVTLIVLGDNSSGGGVVEEVTPLSGHAVGASGTFVIAETSFTLGTADLQTSLNFEDDQNSTFILVRNFTGSDGQDLDTDNDGVLDATPWSAVVDCVSIVIYLGQQPIYCSDRVFGDGFSPGHVTRNATGWFSDTFTPSSTSDTPGVLEFDPASAIAGVIAPWGVGAHGEPTGISVNASFVRLPEGFNRALFVTVVDDFRDEVDGAFVTFTSSDPAVVTSDQFGNLKAEGIGTATLTLTVDGFPAARTEVDVDVIADAPSGVAFQDHLEFGTPTDDTPSDEHLIVRDEYALSYNATRGGANWVAWNLDGSHIGTAPRCECYTPDPLRPAGSYGVVNFDYTGSGYSRGHVTQSFNRTVTLPDNAATYFTSNILPMSSANNSGPWGDFENYTTNRARNDGDEVYIVAGGEYAENAPTLKNQGTVAIPSWTWKVAVFLDRDETLADVATRDDIEIIAIRTPNRLEAGVDGSIAGISRDWETYVIEVDELEALIGYDLLALLPDAIEAILESDFDRLEDAWAVAAPSIVNGPRNALGSHLAEARAALIDGRRADAIDELAEFVHLLGVFERNRRLDPATADALRAYAERVITIVE